MGKAGGGSRESSSRASGVIIHVAFYADKDYTDDQAVLDAMTAQVMAGQPDSALVRRENRKGQRQDRRSAPRPDLQDRPRQSTDTAERLRIRAHQQSMVARGSDKPGNFPTWATLSTASPTCGPTTSRNCTKKTRRGDGRRRSMFPGPLEEHPLKPRLEAACAQLYTFLQECALVALDFPSRWVRRSIRIYRAEKLDVRADVRWARLIEAFRKRALYGGGGSDAPASRLSRA